MESPRDGTYIGLELFEGANGFVGGEGDHAVEPGVSGGNIYEEEVVAITTQCDTVTKDNVHVDLV